MASRCNVRRDGDGVRVVTAEAEGTTTFRDTGLGSHLVRHTIVSDTDQLVDGHVQHHEMVDICVDGYQTLFLPSENGSPGQIRSHTEGVLI